MKPEISKLNRIVVWSLLGLFLLGFIGLAAFTGWDETLAQLEKISPLQISALLGLSLVNYVTRGIRWHMYTRALGLNTGIIQDFRHYLGGFAFTVTPGRVGELIRVSWISRETGAPYTQSLPLVVVDRAADLVSTGILLALGLALSSSGIVGGVPVAISAVAMAIIATRPELFHWIITRLWKTFGQAPRLLAKTRRAARQLSVFSSPKVALPAFVLGGIGWFAEGYSFHLLLTWFGSDIGVWTAVAIFLFAMMAGGATGLPGGIGGAEAIMVGLLTLQGVPLETSVPATAIIRASTLWFAMLIGLGIFPWAEQQATRGKHALEND